MAEEDIVVDYDEDEVIIKAEEEIKEEENDVPTTEEPEDKTNGKESAKVVDSSSRSGEKRSADNSSRAHPAEKRSADSASRAHYDEKRREKRHRIQNMFDVTNMTYEQYVEKHYTLLYEEWFANNVPNQHFYPVQPVIAAPAAVMQPPAYQRT